jgi:hypothetical protein
MACDLVDYPHLPASSNVQNIRHFDGPCSPSAELRRARDVELTSQFMPFYIGDAPERNQWRQVGGESCITCYV